MDTLITGGAGFLGSALVHRLLAEGHRVDVVDTLVVGSLANLAEARRGGREFTFAQLDVRSPEVIELIARRRPEVVYHLAGLGSTADIVANADVNVVGTLNVLDGAVKAGCRKVVVTSDGAAVYGDTDELPARENQPRRPRTPHAIAQHTVDAYLSVFAERHGLVFTSLACGEAYGLNGGMVSLWARALLAGESIAADASASRDFVYVDDVVDALARAGAHGDGLILNIGTGLETSLGQLFTLVADASAPHRAGAGPPVLAPAASPELIGRSALDPTRAGLHLDWRAWTPLETGVGLVVDTLVEAIA